MEARQPEKKTAQISEERVETRGEGQSREGGESGPSGLGVVGGSASLATNPGGGGALPPGFDGEALATDRYAAIGDGPDLVGARLHFVREIEGISAPCHAFETRDWEVLAHLVERGCSCDLHEPETSRCALDLEGLGDLMQSPARERAHTLGGRN